MRAHGTVFHHGDCIGADAEAHDIAVAMACEIVIHSPIVEDQARLEACNARAQAGCGLCRTQGILMLASKEREGRQRSTSAFPPWPTGAG